MHAWLMSQCTSQTVTRNGRRDLKTWEFIYKNILDLKELAFMGKTVMQRMYGWVAVSAKNRRKKPKKQAVVRVCVNAGRSKLLKQSSLGQCRTHEAFYPPVSSCRTKHNTKPRHLIPAWPRCEFQQFILTTSTYLNTLRCCHVIGWSDICAKAVEWCTDWSGQWMYVLYLPISS